MHDASNDTSRPPRGWLRPYRSSRRRRTHEQTLLDDTGGAPPQVPDHPLVPAGDAVMVTDAKALASLIERLKQTPRFGYDSEFIGEHSYFPKLCLVQISTPDAIVLIDALADLDLNPFWHLITDPSIEKIVHCGIQDLEPAYRHTGRPPANIYDTQIAAAFMGAGYPRGLASMVEEFIDIQLPHEMKFTQWDTRPLSARQLIYAANDVRYLHLLRQKVAQRLSSSDQSRWAAEQTEGLCSAEAYRFDVQNEKLMRRATGGLGRLERQVLEDLIAWRDATAREEDVPPRSLIRDTVLMDMCRHPLHTVEDLREVRGLPRPVIRHCAEALLHVVEEAQRRSGPPVERQRPIPPELRPQFNQMWQQIRNHCEENGIDPAVVANKQHVVTYFKNILQGGSNADGPMQTGWRRELLGPLLDHWYDLLRHE